MKTVFKRMNELDIKATVDRLQRLYDSSTTIEMKQACYHLITLLPVVKMSFKGLLKYINNMPDPVYSSYLLNALELSAVERVK